MGLANDLNEIEKSLKLCHVLKNEQPIVSNEYSGLMTFFEDSWSRTYIDTNFSFLIYIITPDHMSGNDKYYHYFFENR